MAGPKKAAPKAAETKTAKKKVKEETPTLAKSDAVVDVPEEREIVYAGIELHVHSYANGTQLTPDMAKEILGWQEVGEKDQFHFFDPEDPKKRVFLGRNARNRPFRKGLADTLGLEILRGKWKLNGETIIVDRLADVQSGQHRLVGLILADIMKRTDFEKWSEYGWTEDEPVTMETCIVYGIHEDDATINTIDTGQKRSLGDVLYRSRVFAGKSDKLLKKLTGQLANATRLVWLRHNGQNVSDAPSFPHSEALDFLEKHPKLLDAVEFIYGLDTGADKGGSRLISRYLNPGVAAGMMYLMGMSATDYDEYLESGKIDDTLWAKGEEFWQRFVDLDERPMDPVWCMRKMIPKLASGGTQVRDELNALIAKTFNAFIDDKEIDPVAEFDKTTGMYSSLDVEKGEDDKGKVQLIEDPRMGGLDVPKEEAEE